jgi:putative tryptophan/tyrosine transport system substrate-binding protein
MRRRDLAALLGGSAVAWPLAARAQHPTAKMPRIGIIDDAPIWTDFRQGLHDLGYVEGHTIAFEYRTAEGEPERLVAAANELARIPVDVIVVYGTAPAHAALVATSGIPIVAISVGDPVRARLVESLAHPGANLTGNTILGPEIGAKRTQLLKELIPTVSRIAFLWNPDNDSHITYREELRAAVPALGVQMIFVRAGSSDDLKGALEAMMQDQPDAFTMTGDPFHQLHLPWILDFIAKHRLPAMYQLRENVIAGGLVSYGASQPDLFRRAAGYVQKILQGTKPADLPVEEPVKFDLVVNLKTAKALGLAVPESFLLRADEVIE